MLLKKWQWMAGWRGWLEFGCTMVLGGLVVGALRPTNTWDFPTYLILAGLVIFYTGIRYGKIPKSFMPFLGVELRRMILSAGAAALFAGLAFLLYQPFAHWYGQAYTALDLYKGDRSAFWSYITHWGLFLFILLSWFIQESVDWMTKTPASKLSEFETV